MGDGADGEGNFVDVGFVHGFVEGEVDAFVEKAFGFGADHLGVVHGGKAEVTHGPGVGEEVVVLEEVVAVDGIGQITIGTHAFGSEGGGEFIARASQGGEVQAEDVVVERMGVLRSDLGGQNAGEIGDRRGQTQAHAGAGVDDGVVFAELGGADGRERFTHPVVVGEFVGIPDPSHAVVALVSPFREVGANLVVVGAHHTTVAAGQVLIVIEGIAAQVADQAHDLIPVAGAPGLGAVFDDNEVVLLTDRHHRVHVAGVTAQVHGEDTAGLGRDRVANGCGIRVVSAGIDIDENRDEQLVQNSENRPHVGDGGHEDLVTGFEFHRSEGEMHGRGARRTGEDMF